MNGIKIGFFYKRFGSLEDYLHLPPTAQVVSRGWHLIGLIESAKEMLK